NRAPPSGSLRKPTTFVRLSSNYYTPPSTRPAADQGDAATASRIGPCGPPLSRGQALALLDANDHAGAVNVRDLERDDLRGAQSRPIGNAQRRLVLEARRRIQQTRHLLRAQHDRQPPPPPDQRPVGHRVRPAPRHHEQE